MKIKRQITTDEVLHILRIHNLRISCFLYYKQFEHTIHVHLLFFTFNTNHPMLIDNLYKMTAVSRYDRAAR